jgi:hypothetical protein
MLSDALLVDNGQQHDNSPAGTNINILSDSSFTSVC